MGIAEWREQLKRGEVSARITAPSGAAETVRFLPPAGDGLGHARRWS